MFPSAAIDEVPAPARRVVGRLRGSRPDRVLVVIAGLHGNEPAGVHGLGRVIARLEDDPSGLVGELVGILGNRQALAAGRRFLREDLNRIWLGERVERLRAGGAPSGPEEEEMLAIDRELRPVFAAATAPVHVLDLHTTSASGPPFAVLDDTLANRAFALNFRVPLVLGLEEELDGPLLHHLLDAGAITMGFESGQHQDPAAVDVAEAAVWVALEASGVLAAASRPEVEAARRLLDRVGSDGLPRVTEVRYRHAVTPNDGFTMLPGLSGFQSVTAGQVLAGDRDGDVLAPESGLMLMPLYQSQGNDGFFVVREIRPLWLRVSAGMRRLRLERMVHWLPGVERHPELPGTYVVDRRVARWFALEVFHLLGFRRHGRDGDKLVVSRRS